jgi:hypothetical protein
MFFREDQLIELCDFSYFHQVGERVPALAPYILSLIGVDHFVIIPTRPV